MQHRHRDYVAEGEAAALSRGYVRMNDHPLGGAQMHSPLTPAGVSTPGSPSSPFGADPLSSGMFHDSLTGPTASVGASALSRGDPFQSGENTPTSSAKPKAPVAEGGEEPLPEWDAKKAYILQKFATTGPIKVTASFDILSSNKGKNEKQSAEARIAELEDPMIGGRTDNQTLTMQESITRLRELNQEIAYAWLNNERVTALKTSIKVARLLSDTSVPQFYPTLFVLVTEVMDTVGRLVYDRIHTKAEKEDDGTLVTTLPKGFKASQVRQDAKDTCTNWFYKIGAIPDLLSRIYLEVAIVRCMCFLQDEPPVQTFERLTMMMRGLSDPLAAVYARSYLVRRAAVVLPPSEKGFMLTALSDFLRYFARLAGGEFDQRIAAAGLTRTQYVALLQPGLQWILDRACLQAERNTLQQVSRLVAQPSTAGAAATSPQLIRCLVDALPAEFVASGALAIATMIKRSGAAVLAAHKHHDPRSGKFLKPEAGAADAGALADVAASFRALGEKLCSSSPPHEVRQQLAGEVWKVVAKWHDLEAYLFVADVYIEYCLVHLGADELDIMLRDVHAHLAKKPRLADTTQGYLESLVFRVLERYGQLADVMGMPHFISILDAFHGERRVAVAERLLRAVCKSDTRATIQDPVVLHFIFEQACTAHDALDSMNAESERRATAALISKFVLKADFGRDFESHLNFLVDCRRAFSRMEAVQATLVHTTNHLAMRTLKRAKGKPNSRIVAFVKACVAYNQITIPSILDTMQQMRLYLVSAQVSLQNGLSQQAEALLRSALAAVVEALGTGESGRRVLERLGPSHEAEFVEWVRTLIGFLVVMPGSPDPKKGPFYIIKGLLKILDDFPWKEGGDGQVRTYIDLVSLMAALVQEKLAYHVAGVDSNDVLYAGDPSFQEELIELTHSLVKRVVSMLSSDHAHSAAGEAARERGARLLDMSNVMMVGLNSNAEMASLVNGLVVHAARLLPANSGYLRRSKTMVQRWLDGHASPVF